MGSIAGSDWLTAEQVARRAGPDFGGLSVRPERWKQDGQIFSVRHGLGEYFPSYGLDPARQYRPIAALANVLRVFGDTKDG